MIPQSPHHEATASCAHLGSRSREAAEAEATSHLAAWTGAGGPVTRGAVLWDSCKRYVLWFLAFFGIYASSSVCVF